MRKYLTVATALFVSAILVSQAMAASLVITSDIGNGAIVTPSATFNGGNPRQGTDEEIVGDFPNNSISRDVILLFQLPATTGATSAELQFQLSALDPVSAVGNEHGDLWGLGYEATNTLDSSWVNFTDTDTAPGVNIPTRTKIQDNILDSSQVAPLLVQTDTAGDAALLAFIQSLYANGAVAGDFAIIRLSPDFLDGGNHVWGINLTADGSATPGHTDTPINPTLTLIPEPASASLLGLGAVLAFRRRRSR